ncbi:inosine-uridine preferring nucleoside hydrolase-domain-containing protein [Aspergillus avenaceus]|uniref:Inosine-uridine preferring nucleoside hydrolase-domain-containing protein n=1 Tax=Aspergillus avenaceus TaxID=36643 RepID=A0A5N6UAU2_ASPAV|nr:inosine-uridine preferring nucleoside hydrolase-domain-containing protein [Aspergillus avenaceus]
MQWIHILAFIFAGLTTGSNLRKKIIIDTDLFSDVDDAGALLLACTHSQADLLGVNINYPSTYSVLAASSILGYYKHSHIPIGVPQPVTNRTFFDSRAYILGEYASKVAYNWRQHSDMPWMDTSSAWDPVQLYRKLLSEQEDQSVTIASIGFLDNLSGLLSSSADAYSPLPGSALVATKVKELVIMGGAYPCGHEYNFYGYNASAAAHVINTWPGRMVFSGAELGGPVYSGARLTVEGPIGDPVKAAYQWYTGYNQSRNSWDPLTVLYAIEGLGRTFVYGNEGGRNYVYPDGRNEWLQRDSPHAQHYLELAVSEKDAGALLDEYFVQGAAMASGQ